jgi:hypothetical protein
LITCHRTFLESRCRERGYTLSEVMPCVVLQNGERWTIDTDHQAYPFKPKPGHKPQPSALPVPVPTYTPGAELKKLLKKVGITATPNCSCNARAAEMDRKGCDWCEQNIDTIVGWLREEAEKRGLPFLDAAGRLLVKRAIRNARKAVS